MSAQRKMFTQPKCKVSASERARGIRGPLPDPTAMGPCRAAQRWADQGGRMFEALAEFAHDPDQREQRRAPRSGTVFGSPFLWFVSFGDPKEMNSPAGARPGLPRKRTFHSKRSSPATGQSSNDIRNLPKA